MVSSAEPLLDSPVSRLCVVPVPLVVGSAPVWVASPVGVGSSPVSVSAGPVLPPPVPVALAPVAVASVEGSAAVASSRPPDGVHEISRATNRAGQG